MSHDNFRVITDTPMLLGECPLWHPQEAALYWIDIDGCAVHRFDPSDGTRCCWRMPCEPGCIAWCASGGLLVALRSGLVLLDTDSGALTELSSAPYDASKVRFNDGRCDVAGRLWVGSLYEPRDRSGGSLFCVEHGVIRDAGRAVTVSNGIAFSTDSRTLYHTDTTAHRISAYDLEVATGELRRTRVFKQFDNNKSAPNYGGRPDGAAVDSEGAYWCAMFEGSRILRLSPGGETLREVKLPLRCPTMIAFGGKDFRTLYITSASHKRPPEELALYPLSGHILAITVDVAGIPEHAYLR